MEIVSEAIARTRFEKDLPKAKTGDNRKNVPFDKPCSYDLEHAERSSSNQLHHRTLRRLWKGGYLRAQTMGGL